jgi:hypothetical protein
LALEVIKGGLSDEGGEKLYSQGSSRRLNSWIDGFVQLTEGTSSPVIFRKWTALSIIAGALEQKVWIRTTKRLLRPNLYVLLVGKPGVGKSSAIFSTNMLRKLPEVHMAPTSVSKASLADAMGDAVRTIVRPGDLKPITAFNSLYVSAEELGNFLSVYENDFMSALNSMYDCALYRERKRSLKTELVIENPQLNILAGTTPGWLASNFPQYAWQEGFASRLMLVYSEESKMIDPWAEDETDLVLEAALEEDLSSIHNMFGIMKFDDEVMSLYKEWLFKGQKPVPDHPKLEHYRTRRPAHLFKLCMCMSAQRTDDRIISVDDYNQAMELLLEIELSMPTIFREMNSGGDRDVIDEAFAFIESTFVRDQAAVPEYKLIHFLSKRVFAREVKKILEIMVESNVIRPKEIMGPGGRPTYIPVPKSQHNL